VSPEVGAQVNPNPAAQATQIPSSLSKKVTLPKHSCGSLRTAPKSDNFHVKVACKLKEKAWVLGEKCVGKLGDFQGGHALQCQTGTDSARPKQQRCELDGGQKKVSGMPERSDSGSTFKKEVMTLLQDVQLSFTCGKST
jgi:hypothetical protein